MSTHSFPHPLYLVHHLPTNSYGSVYVEDERGLACFGEARAAHRFAKHMETRRNLIIEMTMADACEVADQAHLSALVLADAPHAPLIHHLPGRKSRF